jgi:hypothetical protein
MLHKTLGKRIFHCTDISSFERVEDNESFRYNWVLTNIWFGLVWFMVSNATFNNISVITDLWQAYYTVQHLTYIIQELSSTRSKDDISVQWNITNHYSWKSVKACYSVRKMHTIHSLKFLKLGLLEYHHFEQFVVTYFVVLR